MALSASDYVRTGCMLPLTPAPITLDVWRPILPPDVYDLAHPDSPLQGDHEARGDRWAWGDVLERLLPSDPEAPVGLRTWEVILSEAQRPYQAAPEGN
jgi:hypothetical protein